MQPRLTTNDRKGLWAVLWRLLVFGPVLWLLGFALLIAALYVVFVPLYYALYAFVGGNYVIGILILTGYAVLLRLTRKVWEWLLQGIEFSSL